MCAKKSKFEVETTNVEEEKSVEVKIKYEKVAPYPFFSLYQYASALDKVLLVVGIIFALILGAGFPAMTITMGQITDTFLEYQTLLSVVNMKIPNKTERYAFYIEHLSTISDDQIFFNMTKQYFADLQAEHGNSTLIIGPDYIQVRLGYSLAKIVDIYRSDVFQNGTHYVDNFQADSDKWSFVMLAIAAGFVICNFLVLSTFAQAAKNQVYQIKLLFFRSIVHQDISWFDTKSSGDFATKITGDLDIIQEGIGDKVSLSVMSFATVCYSIGVAFYYGWELTLVVLAVMPILGMVFLVVGKIQSRYSASESSAYSKAGAIASEVIKQIRTVYAFGGQEKEIKRYYEHIEPARSSGIKRSMFTGISMGIFWAVMYSSYGLAFWYGIRLILRSVDNMENPPKYQASTMMIIFMNIMMGTFSMGSTAPYFEAIARARGAATLIFQVIHQKPTIDSSSSSGKKLTNMKGSVEFRNVHFNYPSRKDSPILRGMHLEARPGETIALVGPSGCGKSTIVQLIQRFYDPNSGDVFIDGENVKNLNVGSLRDCIGVVGQEPVLFDYTIMENIKLGYPEASVEDVIQASKNANCYDFIQKLTKKFDTLVGESGSQLSGGQKQRIAIARALVRKPKILLLDESTSALDSESESIVQAALDRASVGRTTFVVAHRLSTIRNAHKIIVIEKGQVREMGTHNELIEAKGLYYSMAKLQQQHKMQEDTIEKIQNEKFRSKSVASLGKVDLSAALSHTQKEAKEDNSVSFRRLYQLVKVDKRMLIIATLSAFVGGFAIPGFTFVLSEIFGVISNLDRNTISSQTTMYALILVAMGFGNGLMNFVQQYLFGICSENLTYRLRKDIFRTILRQEVGWFDEESNSTGALCARLSYDAASVNGATGSRLPVLAQVISVLLTGVVMSLYYNWKLGLVMMCFIPLLIFAVGIQMRVMYGMQGRKRKIMESASKIAVDALSNIRTVASLHQEENFFVRYQMALESDFRKSRYLAAIRGITFGLSQGLNNFAYAVSFLYGSRLIINGELDYASLSKCTQGVLFGTTMIGQAIAFSPEYQRGKIAAASIFRLFDRVPRILVSPTLGKKPTDCSGDITFNGVEFHYPSRPENQILRGISFSVTKGQTLALVGSSGCGKSTCTQLLERFYTHDGGEVNIDNENILNLNIPWLRSQIGIVSQEPALFDKTILDNIAYGDNSQDSLPMDEIVRAAQRANIHTFIQSLPAGYNTSVGEKGVQLSGGQKQRIAIARALVRNPKILLLDEATSALDSESEKVVQEALDEARLGRTCLIIAHRLSTIQNVDKIVVLAKGVIIEQGTHDQLMELKGTYYQMYTTQVGFY